MLLITRLLELLMPTRVRLADLKDRLDTLEWRLTCLEARAAQEAFTQEYGTSYTCGCQIPQVMRDGHHQ
jgi:hypothetical protein